MDQPGDIDARSPPNAGRPKLQELGAESARSFVSNAASTLEWLHSNPETEEEEKLYQFPVTPAAVNASTMQTCVESGDAEAVRLLLDQASNERGIDMLTKTYGGHVQDGSTDETLSAGSTPILHAARSGHESVFYAVLYALRSKLDPQSLSMALRAKDSNGSNVLALAARSGSKGAFEAALGALKSIFVRDEVISIIKSRDLLEATVLAESARRGSRVAFDAVLAALGQELSSQEVKEMLYARDADGTALPTIAAANGNADTLESVLSALWLNLPTSKVLNLVTCANACGVTMLLAAIRSGDHCTLRIVLECLRKNVDREQMGVLVMRTDVEDCTLLLAAVRTGDTKILETVLTFVREYLAKDQVTQMMVISSIKSDTLLLGAVLGRNVKMLEAVFKSLWQDVSRDEVRRMMMVTDGMEVTLLLAAVRTQHVETLEALLTRVRMDLNQDQVRHLLLSKDINGGTPLPGAVGTRNIRVLEVVLELLREDLVGEEVAQELAAAFVACTRMAVEEGDAKFDGSLEMTSLLLQNSARPSRRSITELSRQKPYVWLKSCYLGAVTCAKNPFIPGMTLSVVLAAAAKKAPEGERRRLLSLQESVEALLLEILERLPKTVRGFQGGMGGCSAIFEPENCGGDLDGAMGPLSLALQERHQLETFCTQPLVMDFLSRRFAQNLPNLRDTAGVLADKQELRYLAGRLGGRREDSLIAGSPDGFIGGFVQGTNASLPRTTILPGVQFIVAGILAKPNIYFGVPAMRMSFDFVVYVAMIIAFTKLVLFHEDGPLSAGECIFAIYICAAVMTEVGEMRKGLNSYLTDHWNNIDVLGLTLMGAGFATRAFYHDSPWGRGLYSLSAPLVFARVLFFAQILRFQGPMIQVIFSMTAEIVQFGLVALVVILGFTMSFYSLFRTSGKGYGSTWLDLFGVILGDIEWVEEIPDDSYNPVPGILFVAFNIIMTIMLLNLLVAVLTTSHAKIEANADREFKVSKARLIEHYRMVVDERTLPAPFNLVQHVLSSPFFLIDGCCRSVTQARVERATGYFVFWLVSGPLAIVGGALLWMISALYFPLNIVCRERSVFASIFWYIVYCMWYCVGAPVFLVCLWIGGPLLGAWRKLRGHHALEVFNPSIKVFCREEVSVDELLKAAPGGLDVRDLWKYLEDPMCDPEVRQDEINRRTTVEHIKLLRDRLEATVEKHFDKHAVLLDEKLGSVMASVNDRLRQLEKLGKAELYNCETILQRLDEERKKTSAAANAQS